MFDEFLLSQTNSLSLRDSYIEKSVEKQKEQYEREEARINTIPRVSSLEGVDSGARSGNNANIQGGTSRQTSGYGVRTEATQDDRGTAQEEAFGNRRGSKHFRSASRGGLLSDDTRYALSDMPFFSDEDGETKVCSRILRIIEGYITYYENNEYFFHSSLASVYKK
jgi:hypothetical protein